MKFNFDSAKRHVKSKVNYLLKKNTTVLIGIAGGSCSGKTTFANYLGYPILSLDDYYVGLERMKDKNFDNPQNIDLELLTYHLKELKKGNKIYKPKYDFIEHKRKNKEIFFPKKVISLEGLFALHEKIVEHLDIKVFIEAKQETCLRRRIKRDLLERGRTEKEIMCQFNRDVIEGFVRFVLPTKRGAIVVKND